MTFPNREEVLTNSDVVWLSCTTIQDLKRIADDDDRTCDDVIQRLIEETKRIVDIEELVSSYLEARGKGDVAQLAVETQSIRTETLHFIVHGGKPDQSLPDIIEEADAVVIGDEVYDFNFYETYNGPQESGRLTIYASENILGMDSLDVDQGVRDLKNAVTETTIDIKELVELAQSRVDAVAVAATLNSDGIRFDVVRNELEGHNTDRFRHIQRVTISDEVLPVHVSDQYIEDHIRDEIIVWRSDRADSGEGVPYEEGVETLSMAMAESK